MARSVALDSDRIAVGDSFGVAFQRTLRIPDDGKTYPLPPGFGRLPIRRLQLKSGSESSTLIVPLHRHEAMWLGFESSPEQPHAVVVGLGRINGITGGPWSDRLDDRPQNYLVSPPQMWLDGFKVTTDRIRQFVATTLDTGTTVESQLTGEDEGTLRVVVYPPHPERLSAIAPRPAVPGRARAPGRGLGLGAGGQIRQRIYPDPHGLDVWDSDQAIGIAVRLVTPYEFKALTGDTPPPTPIDAAAYTEHGLPWFEVYDEPGDLAPTKAMQTVQSIHALEGSVSEPSVDVPEIQILPAQGRSRKKPRF